MKKETCPFCSAEINELGECKVTCGHYKDANRRLAHDRLLGLSRKMDNAKKMKGSEEK